MNFWLGTLGLFGPSTFVFSKETKLFIRLIYVAMYRHLKVVLAKKAIYLYNFRKVKNLNMNSLLFITV